MNEKDEEAFFEVWFQLQRHEDWKRKYPTEAFHENWGMGAHDDMLTAWKARAGLHVTPAERNHDYTSPRCWCGEANYPKHSPPADCRSIAGRGVCDMCAQGDYEKCRYASDRGAE